MTRKLPFWLRLGLRMAPRTFWAALLGIHLPILAATVGSLGGGDLSVGRWMALAILLPTTAFFALKLIDVRWLRWRSRPAAMIAFTLICAIVHHDAVATAADQPATWEVAALVITAGAAAAALRKRRLDAVRLVCAQLAAALSPVEVRQFRAVLIDRRPPAEQSAAPATVPRAPPC